jgi:hypothetical protein
VLGLLSSTVALAQPAQRLPSGAVLKPEKPKPVVPLEPREPSAQMKPLQPLVGSFSGTTSAGAPVTVQCQPAASQSWIRCEAATTGWSAIVLVGWDAPAHAYRALVADERPSFADYILRVQLPRIVANRPNRVSANLQDPEKIVISVGSQLVTFVRDR